ncbi:WD40 repeat domain-containing protein [Sphingobacterium faecale]|uniref:WD40 repeat domain-containing protein n=1 Tax=Sphingobacterium faecale TaxID=2803775 RepID=A0ABS1QZ52_9SPHI|nr:WD40 repeat domain-containing protein [Sphingobacterium faecale]MBL1407713.1 WD40 repeat domain-containing protein [Sphingobacterium faecale]
MTEISLHGTLTGHQNPIYTLEVDIDKHLLYSAGNDKGIVEWDLMQLKFQRILCAVPASVYFLKIIPGTDWIAAGMRNGELFIIQRTNPRLVAKLNVEKGAIFNIKILTSKNEIIAIGEEGRAYVWSLDTFQLLYTFQVSKETIRTMEVSGDQKTVVFGDKGGMVYIHDAQDFHRIAESKTHEMAISSMLLDDGYLYTGGRDARMYKLSFPSLQKENELTPHFFTVYGIAPLLDKLVTVSRDKTIKIWDRDFRLLKNISRDKGIDSHQLSINSLIYDHVARLLCTAGDDKQIKVWAVEV